MINKLSNLNFITNKVNNCVNKETKMPFTFLQNKKNNRLKHKKII